MGKCASHHLSIATLSTLPPLTLVERSTPQKRKLSFYKHTSLIQTRSSSRIPRKRSQHLTKCGMTGQVSQHTAHRRVIAVPVKVRVDEPSPSPAWSWPHPRVVERVPGPMQ